MRILLVEDHVKTAALVARGLREHSYAVDVASCGRDAVWMGREHEYDAIVLDVVLPDQDGFEVLEQLRTAEQWSPVLMLTARSSVQDRIRGLDGGADDYLVKPFAFGELLARVRVLVRRVAAPRPTTIVVGDLTVNPALHRVERGDHLIRLTPKEFAVLEVLARRAGESVERRELISRCWDFAFDGDPNVLDVYIRYLREKIDRPFGLRSIETVRGVGYRLIPAHCNVTAD